MEFFILKKYCHENENYFLQTFNIAGCFRRDKQLPENDQACAW